MYSQACSLHARFLFLTHDRSNLLWLTCQFVHLEGPRWGLCELPAEVQVKVGLNRFNYCICLTDIGHRNIIYHNHYSSGETSECDCCFTSITAYCKLFYTKTLQTCDRLRVNTKWRKVATLTWCRCFPVWLHKRNYCIPAIPLADRGQPSRTAWTEGCSYRRPCTRTCPVKAGWKCRVQGRTLSHKTGHGNKMRT